LAYIDIDVSVECASPFRFEESGSYLRVNLLNISALSWIRSFNF